MIEFSKHDDPPHSRLFVANIKQVSEEDLRDAFGKYGDLEDVWICKDKNTGERKDIAFIKFSKTSDAARAMEGLNEKTIEGCTRPLKVRIALSRDQSNVGGKGDDMERLLRLFVVVPKTMTDQDITNEFKQYGELDYVSVVKDRETKESKGYAFVKYMKWNHIIQLSILPFHVSDQSLIITGPISTTLGGVICFEIFRVIQGWPYPELSNVMGDGVETAFIDFCGSLSGVIRDLTPTKVLGKRNFPCWFSLELKALVILKKKLHVKFKKSLKDSDYLEFRSVRARCRTLSASCYRDYILRIENSIPSNVKVFWGHIRNMKRKSSALSNLYLDNVTADTPKGSHKHFQFLWSWKPHSICQVFHISCEEVEETLAGLDERKGAGPDGIPPVGIRCCHPAFEECDRSFKAVFARPKEQDYQRKGGPQDRHMDPFDRSFNSSQGNSYASMQQSSPTPLMDMGGSYSHQGYGNNPSPMDMVNNYALASRPEATRLIALVSAQLSEEQVERLFDIVPGLKYCQFQLQAVNDVSNYNRTPLLRKVLLEYVNPNAASYALEKLHGFEYPPGKKIVVKSEFDQRNDSLMGGVTGKRDAMGLVAAATPEITQELATLTKALAEATNMIKLQVGGALAGVRMGGSQ
ncbi:uncharacterized protein LOC124370834, partial [Homalodisca vitripennis]|uniref:uncharacterized protein LOC124370834 n=1 Tax=Homalodisca vitripennis TaxID=197043 RepID=UPI001EE9C439